jgi:hypothetical protein
LQQGINKSCEKLVFTISSDTLVTLTLPCLLVTLPLKLGFGFEAMPDIHGRACLGGKMKKIGLLILLTAAIAGAQSTPADAPPEISAPSGTIATNANFPFQRVQMPTYADLYCAGFINRHSLPDAHFVDGGLETPESTKFVHGDIVYLRGSDYTAGAEYSIVRPLKDIDEYEMYPGERKLIKETGQAYADIGIVRIIDTRNKSAIAQVEFSCDPVNPGDVAIPFAEKTTVAFHPPVRFDRFLPSESKVSGRIVMGKDFDSELGTGQKVYLNLGSNQGVKIGDYFRAVRSYEADLHNPVDSLSFKANINDDTQMKQPSFDPGLWERSNGPVIHVRDLPRRAVGEIVVIGVTPTTATGMIVFAMEDVHAGDGVELDDQTQSQPQ